MPAPKWQALFAAELDAVRRVFAPLEANAWERKMGDDTVDVILGLEAMTIGEEGSPAAAQAEGEDVVMS